MSISSVRFNSGLLKSLLGAAALLTAMLGAQPAQAYVVVPESGDTVASAYAMGNGFSQGFDAIIENSTSIWHSSVTASAGDFTDVDWFSFCANAGSSIHLDIDTDNWGGLVDTTIALWSSTGVLLAQNDDFGFDPGSQVAGVFFYNSQIYSGAGVTGTYFVSVANFANFADGNSPFGDYSGNGFYNEGAYDLHVSLSNPCVPEPTSLAIFGLGVTALVFWRRRK